MVSLHQDKLPVSLDSYLQENFTENLTSSKVASHFHIGRTRLYEICNQNYGRGLAKQIQFMRLKKAKELLSENPEMPVSEVAYQCGYPDYNYFITLFRKETGVSPRKYQQKALLHPGSTTG